MIDSKVEEDQYRADAARAIRAAVDALNEACKEGRRFGLDVELNRVDVTTMADDAPSFLFVPMIVQTKRW